MRRTCQFLSTFIFTASTALAAEEAFTVEEFAREVLARNPEVAFYEAEIAAARGERKSAGVLPNPELNGDVGHKRARDTAGTLAGEGVAWSVGVAQTFEFPGRLALRKAIANRDIDLANLGLSRFKAELAARARTLAFANLAAKRIEAAAREVAGRVQALREVVVQRDPAGVTPLLETRILEANALTAQRRAVEAALAAKGALLELNLLRDKRPDAAIRIRETEPSFVPAPVFDDLMAAAQTNAYELRARQLELEQQGFRVSLARNERWPAVTLGPFYSEERAGDKERIAGVGVNLPLPLWNRNSGNIDVARARRQQAEAALRITQREIERQLQANLAAYATRLDALAQWRADAVERFREAAEAGDRHYRLGAVPIATYVELQEKYLEAVEAYFNLKNESYAAAQRLEVLTGMKFVEGRAE
ncbi:MAG: TolC family protein [Verrucomicrobia subdivision 3 bacterium]|nr:TolC family protein [Limisphaerales bacterium]